MDGERYFRNNTPEKAFWEPYPLENTNPFSLGIVQSIFDQLPLYWVLSTCNLVCKDWSRVIKTIPMATWVDRGNLEWDIPIPIMCGPTWSPFTYLKRVAACVTILKNALESDQTKGPKGGPTASYLISKGFPLSRVRTTLPRLLELYVKHNECREKGLPLTASVAKKVWHTIGPFDPSELVDAKPLREDENKNMMYDRNLMHMWSVYVTKLLGTVGFYPITKHFDQIQGARRGTRINIYRKHSVFITQLGLLLRDKFRVNVVLSDRYALLYEQEQERVYQKEMREDMTERLDRKRQAKEDLKMTIQEAPPSTMPEVKSTTYEFFLGFNVSLGEFSESIPYRTRYDTIGPHAVAVDIDLGLARPVIILVFVNGRVLITRAPPGHIEMLHALIVRLTSPFKWLRSTEIMPVKRQRQDE